jgi:hypothetical protein
VALLNRVSTPFLISYFAMTSPRKFKRLIIDAMERTDPQCVTLFRDGTGRFVMDSGSPRFHSLPELSRFVGEIAARAVVAVADVTRLTTTQTANAS